MRSIRILSLVALCSTVIGTGCGGGGFFMSGGYVEDGGEPAVTPPPYLDPDPENTPRPTPEPTETPTPDPTATVTPEPTETPTPDPTATVTPEPTVTPTPEPTVTPTPTPVPCDCGGPVLQGRTILGADVTASGDAITTANVEIDPDGNLKVTFAPVINPTTGEPYQAADASRMSLTSWINPPDNVSICPREMTYGESTHSSADVAFLVDTTSSMGPAVTGIADSIGAFADSLSAQGLDVSYSIATLGDAYNTKKATGSPFAHGTGIDTPPTFDPCERPLVDSSTDLGNFRAFLDELRNVYPNGCYGAGVQENYYGAAVAMAGKKVGQPGLTRRTGVPFYEILVGDNCSLTAEFLGSPPVQGKWVPPSKNELTSLLGDGSLTIHAVKRQGSPACLPTQIALEEFAAVSGGGVLTFPPTGYVDLTALNLGIYIERFWFTVVPSGCIADPAAFTLNLELTVTDDGGTRTQSFTIQIQTI